MKTLLLVMAIAGSDTSCWVDVSFCATHTSQTERLQCFDDLAANACKSASNPLQPEGRDEVTENAVAQPSIPTSADAKPRSDFGLVELPETKREPQSLEATVVAVKRGANGLRITLDADGQIWRQVDSNRLSLKSGERIRIKQGLGNSFYLNKAKGSRSIRVRRVK